MLRRTLTNEASRPLKRSLSSLDASRLQVNLVGKRKKYPPPEKLVFGHVFSDHMLDIDWTAEVGWHAPKIVPFADLNMHPASCVLHYGFECFEGLKAFRDKDGELRMFRPDQNMARFNKSSQRVALPGFDQKAAVELLQRFVRIEEAAIPDGKGYSLYLRPTMIGTQPTLGISSPEKAKMFVIASPVGPYYSNGFAAIKLEARDDIIRAFPGGVGHYKLGGNYAPCVVPQQEAAKKGYAQNLWLLGGKITEVGSMNLFVIFQNPDGTKELCTPPLDGTILEGITRKSILELARQRLDPGEWKVTEREVHIDELRQRSKKGELLEVFGSGTAAIVSPVDEIGYKGEKIPLDIPASKGAGPTTEMVQKWIQDIQYGIDEHPFCQVVPHF